MRALFAVVFVVSIVESAFAQLDMARSLLGPAYDELSTRQAVRFRIAGSETVAGKVKKLDIDAAFRIIRTDEKVFAQFDLQSFENDVVVERYTGDGSMLWHFDAKSNEYWSARYGNENGVQTAGYVRRLMQMLNSTSLGHVKFIGRLLYDTLGVDRTATFVWNPWSLNSTITVNRPTIHTESGNPRSLVVDYTVAIDEFGLVKLSSIDYWSLTIRGGISTEIAWTLLVMPYQIETSTERFNFVAPRNARMIAQPIRGSGF